MSAYDASNSVEQEMKAHIVATLSRVAADEGVRILYAAESGSRAWGFASPDSDYDVRFIYAHPKAWYLSLAEERDVIERPLDDKLVDLGGWDVRKALRLTLKSNPAFYEWLTSPIVYVDDGVFRSAAKTHFERNANPDVLTQAYISIAKSQFSGASDTEALFKLKRYFYALRPIMAAHWIRDRQTLPPMNLQAMLAGVTIPDAVRAATSELLQRKKGTTELGQGPRIRVLDEWLKDQIAAFSAPSQAVPLPAANLALAEANTVFWENVGL